jgi:mannosyltransferase OCH1-like enzyme
MQNIPKLIHYIWVGGKPLPQRFQKNIESWIEHNPEFKIILWNEDNIDFSHDFIRVAFKQKKWAFVSDFARLAILKQYGGVYLDTDVFTVKSLEPLLTSSCFIGYQEDQYVNNAVLGACPNHWLVSRVYQYYLDLAPVADDASVESLALGPDVINKILKQEGLLQATNEVIESKDVTILPPRYFYPYNWNEEFSDSCVTPDTIAIHFWELSWHLENKSWLRKKITMWLKSNPTLFKNAKKIYRELLSTFKK